MEVQAQTTDVYSRVVGKVERLFSRFDGQIRQRFGVVDTELAELRESYSRLEAMHQAVLTDVQHIQRRLAVAEQQDPDEVQRH